jgi:hypothetical protein
METFVSEISIRQITKLYALVATLQQPLQDAGTKDAPRVFDEMHVWSVMIWISFFTYMFHAMQLSLSFFTLPVSCHATFSHSVVYCNLYMYACKIRMLFIQ